LKDHTTKIKKLIREHNYPDIENIIELPGSGSNRLYFRVFFYGDAPSSLIASYNPDVAENRAWYSFSIHFRNLGFSVPEIYARDESHQYMLLQDLGDIHLLNLLKNGPDDEYKTHYRQAVKDLVRFQVEGIKGLDLDVAYPVKHFDKRSIFWDLNYCKYYFVKPHEILFDESALDNDFRAFSARLLMTDHEFFQYRDFQARNIMIHKSRPWYIDFQGGRKGPLQYDLVSLLYQAKAGLPVPFRNELYQLYLSQLDKAIPGQSTDFEKYFTDFIYFRLMQVLGAYGFRGLIQGKGHFLQSIPYAINNLKQLLIDAPVEKNYPELHRIFTQIVVLKQYETKGFAENKLTVDINSFSYKKNGIPIDMTENNGGFVFDCRALPNPGRIKELKNFNGLERPVIEYLQDKSEVNRFMIETFQLVKQSIGNYLGRGFTHLQVSYGCTGGKHRSVYCARQLADFINIKYHGQVETRVRHIQIEKEEDIFE